MINSLCINRRYQVHVTNVKYAVVSLTSGASGAVFCILRTYLGAIDGRGGGGGACHMSILRNANVSCLCRLFIPMSCVNLRNSPAACQ